VVVLFFPACRRNHDPENPREGVVSHGRVSGGERGLVSAALQPAEGGQPCFHDAGKKEQTHLGLHLAFTLKCAAGRVTLQPCGRHSGPGSVEVAPAGTAPSKVAPAVTAPWRSRLGNGWRFGKALWRRLRIGGLVRFFSEGHREAERGPFAFPVRLDPDLSAVALDDTL
jgi:hypothetical protein